jgi:hypothetical protein
MAKPIKNNKKKPEMNIEDEIFSKMSFKKPEREPRVEDFAENIQRERRSSSRNADNRISSERPALDMDISFGSKFNIPAPVQETDPDYVHGFVAYMANNEQLDDVVEDAMERGWFPCPKSDHPLMGRNYSNLSGGFRETNNEFTRKGGQIHMKRKKELHEAENKKFTSQNQRQDELRNYHRRDDPNSNSPIQYFNNKVTAITPRGNIV